MREVKTSSSDRVIHQIHRNFIAIVAGLVIVGGLITINLYRNGIIGPIQGGQYKNFFLRWKMSDHTDIGDPLQNSLTATDVPRYDNDLVVNLDRETDGRILNLLRYQATLEYYANNFSPAPPTNSSGFGPKLLATPAHAQTPPPAGNIWQILRSTVCQTNCSPGSNIFGSKIVIQLPPLLIITPDKLTFPQSSVVYNFDAKKGQFVPSSGLFNNHQVTTTIDNGGDGAAYVITISGFTIGEKLPLNDFRLTFVQPVSKVNIDKVGDYLEIHSIATARLTGAGCAQHSGSTLCLDTITTVQANAQTLPQTHLLQAIPIKGIYLEGNAGAPVGTIRDFTLTGQAIAVGQTVTSVAGGQELTNYPTSHLSAINWSQVGSSLNAIYGRRNNFPQANTFNNGTIYQGRVWNLNSATIDPSNPQQTTGSTPPEGKVWNIISKGNNFDLGGSGDLNFYGSGTIVVSGNAGQNVSVTIHNHLTCSPGTRLGIITSGDINFVTSAADHLSRVDCGAYASLNGNINFNATNQSTLGGVMKGLFVARGNVVLPDPAKLDSTYFINRDSYFATHPTVLFADLLKIVFSTSG